MRDRGSDALVVQISISQGGIPKRAVPSADVIASGIVGDSWRHPQIHGGADQAILLITAEGIGRRSLRVGQCYRAGEVVLEISKRRAPCQTLNVYGTGIQAAMFDAQVKAGDPASPRWGLSGFYAAVVRTGAMRVGDSITIL
jgi:MOSC domain-containing protein YiiM